MVLPRGRLERATLGVVVLLLVGSLGMLTPSIRGLISPAPSPPPTPTPTPPAPQGVLFADELDRALQSVVTLVVLNDTGLTFGTAVAIDNKGYLLTSAQLLQSARAARVVDNTGGMHAVTVIGIDPTHGIALVRSAVVSAVPLPFGSTSSLQTRDPVSVLASPKNDSLPSSLPGAVTMVATSTTVNGAPVAPLFQLHADLQTGNAGSPVVGYGGKLLGIILPGPRLPAINPMAAPIESAQTDLLAWHGVSGTALPLADLPPGLLLRGSGEASPNPSAAASASLSGVQPAQAKAGQDTTLVIQGSGFVGGAAASVHFTPLSGSTGAFDGRNVAVNSATTIACLVPAGQRVQDYAVSVTNGDGTPVGGTVAFTIIP
ncbi:MAG TPA: trypsin-like peptidase domain-containing protein [Candidatus Limnocylindria bacterium]|nr:trypsin-like peptidase domain-containing protein [Candidatus Limnocylindria bacterium]